MKLKTALFGAALTLTAACAWADQAGPSGSFIRNQILLQNATFYTYSGNIEKNFTVNNGTATFSSTMTFSGGRPVAITQPTNGQVLKFNTSSGFWTPGDDNTGSGSDNLGNHIATRTIVANFGITATTAVFTSSVTAPYITGSTITYSSGTFTSITVGDGEQNNTSLRVFGSNQFVENPNGDLRLEHTMGSSTSNRLDIGYFLRDNGETLTKYFDMVAISNGITDGAENGIVQFHAMKSGTLFMFFDYQPSIATLRIPDNLMVRSSKSLKFEDVDQSNTVAFKAATNLTADTTWTLPTADSAGCFQSDGAGTVSIGTCGSGADNLGNHIATTTLVAGFGISGSTAVFSSSVTVGALLSGTTAIFSSMTVNGMMNAWNIQARYGIRTATMTITGITAGGFLRLDGSGNVTSQAAIDISADTNLTVEAPVLLVGDEIRVDKSSVTLLGGSIDLSGPEASGFLADARFGALTGDVTSSSGSATTTIADNAVDGTDISLSGEATGHLTQFNGTDWVATSSTVFMASVLKGGVFVSTRTQLNFIEGTGVTLTIADGGANDRVNITIAASASGADNLGNHIATTTVNATAAGIKTSTLTVTNFGPGVMKLVINSSNVVTAQISPSTDVAAGTFPSNVIISSVAGQTIGFYQMIVAGTYDANSAMMGNPLTWTPVSVSSPSPNPQIRAFDSDAAISTRPTGVIAWDLTATGDGTESSLMRIQLINNGSTVTYATFYSTGNVFFKNDVQVPDEVYGAGWDGSLEVPTKNALYDKIQTLGAGGTVAASSFTFVFRGEAMHVIGSSQPFISYSTGEASGAVYFDETSTQAVTMTTMLVRYNGNTLYLDVIYKSTATTGTINFGAYVECKTVGVDAIDGDTDSYDVINSSSVTVGATANMLGKATITLTNVDSCADGDQIRIKLTREAGSSDTSVGFARVAYGILREN